MVNQPALILYDAQSKKGTFSPFVFHTRLVLGYKHLPFKTEWVPLTGIKKLFEEIRIPPTPHPIENLLYTVPALIDTSVVPAAIISQSANINRYLDEKFPEHPVWSVSPPNVDTEDANEKLAFLKEVAQYLSGEKDPRYAIITTLVVPAGPVTTLLDVDIPYFRETRSRWFNAPFDEIEPKDKQAALNIFKESLNDFAEILDGYRGKPFDPEDPQGRPWVLDNTISWADFALVGLFKWIETLNPPIWDEIKLWNEGRWLRMMEETAQWL